ncbi:uncharacterized protein LOC126299161 [Schistocerca gregaria]|uniref:uncharacterized protein LOC126299161 n=1 Tax=Schistocerca gregaria TaxID=7010 RepID=UPI00211DC5A9|nr:uncharacterized protein LOC126299161 [Schistocerca gregaria]
MAQFSVLSVLFVALPICFSMYYDGEEFLERDPKDLRGSEYDRPVYAIFTSAEEYDKYTSLLEDGGIRALDSEEVSAPELKVIISDGDLHQGLRVAGFLSNIYPSLAAMVTMFVTSALKIPWMLLGGGSNSTTTTTAAPATKQEKARVARYIPYTDVGDYSEESEVRSLPIDPLPLPSTSNTNHFNTLVDVLLGDYPHRTHTKMPLPSTSDKNHHTSLLDVVLGDHPSRTRTKIYHLPAADGDFHFVTKVEPQSSYNTYDAPARQPVSVAVPVLFLVPYPFPYPVVVHLHSEPGKDMSQQIDNNFPVRVAIVTEKNETTPADSDSKKENVALNVTTPAHKAS